MHALKLCFSVLLTLSVMRAGSWIAAWLLSRFMTGRVRTVAVAANLIAFVAFLLLLNIDPLPGESIDLMAASFGLIVFAIYTLSDFFWRPWKQPV